MPIFPALGPEYYDEKDRSILERMEVCYSDWITPLQSFWGEADTDLRYYMGDQSVYNDLYGAVPVNRRRWLAFNRIRRIPDLTSGYQRRNRKSTVVVPMENADSHTADQFTKILMWIAQQEGVLETISDAFEGSLITGMNLLHVWVDYRSDPVSGDIKVTNKSYNSFLIDPFFTKHDLSDCTGIWTRSYLTKRECLSLMPEKTEQIMGLFGQDNRDGKFQFMPQSYNWSTRSLLSYDEFYYRDYRKQKMLVDTQTGETLEWKHDDEEKLKLFLQMHPQVTVIEQEIPTVRLAIVIEGRVMYDGPNPLGIDSYPFVPVVSYYHPESPYYPFRVQGMVRGLRDAQYLYNRRKIIELDILESQINSGYIYKENALVNPKDIFMSGQGKGLALKDEAQMSDVQPIPAPGIPPSMIQLSEILAREIQEISGVNEELLGSATDDKAGILSMLRQGAGLTTLQGLFDKLDFSQKLLGKLMIDLIQTNYTPGKIQKILEGQQPSEQFYSKAFGKYHASVEEGLNTTTQKQMQFAQMLQLRQAGVPIPDDQLLDAATLQNKSELIKAVQQNQQQAQNIQQMQAQIALEEVKSRIELNNSRSVADKGLGLERISRVEENKALAVERRAEAVKDREIGLLNLVKALKEVDDIDLSHIEKLISLSNIVKQREATMQQESTVSPSPEMV